jgi:hypothetical protein
MERVKVFDQSGPFVMEINFKHYSSDEARLEDYDRSTFPHPLITIDWDDDKEPITVNAVGYKVYALADAIAKGGDAKAIVERLVEREAGL